MTLRTRVSRPARLAFVAGFLLPFMIGHPPVANGDPPTPTLSDTPAPAVTTAAPPDDTPDTTPVETVPSPADAPESLPSETPATPSETPTQTATEPTLAEIEAPTQTPTTTPTPVPVSAPTPYPPLSMLVHEVAWAGTLASATDEWIELYNNTASPIDLTGWRLTDDGDIRISLAGIISGYGCFLLERTDDNSVADVAADQLYTGGLNNGGETLYLFDPTGAVVDSANADGGGWPAGSATSCASMERWGGEDRSRNWGTFTGY